MGLFDRLDKPVFLKETSDSSEYINKLQILQEKASGKLKEQIDREIKLTQIGEFGENNIAFELKNAAMPMYVLRDVHYETGGLNAQIDYIVITRKLIFLIECKNLIGDITIDGTGNFIREYLLYGKKVKEGIYSPITQNKRHLDILFQLKKDNQNNLLKKVLIDKYFYGLHRSIVVLANPKTILNAKFAKKDVKDQVIRADQLIKYIKEANNLCKELPSNDKELLSLAERLLSLHTPNLSDYSKKYEALLSQEPLQTEVVEEVKPIEEAKPKYEAKPKFESKPSINMTATLSDDNRDTLIKNLKAYRLETCRKENIKPYFIFNDKQMDDILLKMPKSKKDLLSINGFADAKVEKYGEAILKIINQS